MKILALDKKSDSQTLRMSRKEPAWRGLKSLWNLLEMSFLGHAFDILIRQGERGELVSGRHERYEFQREY